MEHKVEVKAESIPQTHPQQIHQLNSEHSNRLATLL